MKHFIHYVVLFHFCINSTTSNLGFLSNSTVLFRDSCWLSFGSPLPTLGVTVTDRQQFSRNCSCLTSLCSLLSAFAISVSLSSRSCHSCPSALLVTGHGATSPLWDLASRMSERKNLVALLPMHQAGPVSLRQGPCLSGCGLASLELRSAWLMWESRLER